MKAEPLRLRRGDLVQTWFDTGALGATILYGIVIGAGPRLFWVRWESGLVNHITQGNTSIRRAEDRETAENAVKHLEVM